MREIERVVLVLKDRQEVSFRGEDVGFIKAGPFNQYIDGYGYGAIDARSYTEYFSIELFRTHNNSHTFNIIVNVSNIAEVYIFTMNSGKRYYKHFHVHWSNQDKNGQINKCQVSYVSEHGNCYISIAKSNIADKQRFVNSLDLEEINDPEYMLKIQALINNSTLSD